MSGGATRGQIRQHEGQLGGRLAGRHQQARATLLAVPIQREQRALPFGPADGGRQLVEAQPARALPVADRGGAIGLELRQRYVGGGAPAARAQRLQQVGLTTALRPAQPHQAGSLLLGERLELRQRDLVRSGQKAFERGAIVQAHAQGQLAHGREIPQGRAATCSARRVN